jgi:hypothetical protein
MKLLSRPMGPLVEACSGIAVACFLLGFGTLANLIHESARSTLAALLVLAWAGWVLRKSVVLLRDRAA